MPIPAPTFDSRSYRELLNEALARIPVHNPEWTNFNDSDPGVTLLQLFAFMTESLIYRANLIPERNRRAFLRLLGVPLRAAAAASGLVSFDNPRGALKPILLHQEQKLCASKVPFCTQNSLQVLPITARLYYKSPLPTHKKTEVETHYRRLYASFATEGQRLSFYETKTFTSPSNGVTLPVINLSDNTSFGNQWEQTTIDGSLWLALLTRSPKESPETVRKLIANQILTLGLMPALDAEADSLHPINKVATEIPRLIFEVPNTTLDNKLSYSPLKARADADILSKPGLVELTLPDANKLNYWTDFDPLEAGTGDYPPSLEETDVQKCLITWIRIRSPALNSTPSQFSTRLSWIGINAARIVQQDQVKTEPLPAGTGEPDQSAVLSKTPVILDSVKLTVNGEVWQRIDDLNTAAPEVPPRSPRLASETLAPQNSISDSQVFSLDCESGEVRFGDGIHGMRPPINATIQVSYAYGGGSAGMVGIGSINKGSTLPTGLKVNNPVPTWGGSEGESIAQAEKSVPSFLQHRDRLVSVQDFMDITWRTPGVELGRVEVLPLFHPAKPAQNSEGVVTVLVIPRTDAVQPEAPRPERLFLENICTYLAPRRLITTEIQVRGPVYQPIWVSIGIEVVPGWEQAEVREQVKEAIEFFLSPLTGGFEKQGWPLNKAVEVAEISAAATRVNGVAKVNNPLRLGSSGAVSSIEMTGLSLPRLMAVAVTVGDAIPLETLRGETERTEKAPDIRIVPVPVIPETC